MAIQIIVFPHNNPNSQTPEDHALLATIARIQKENVKFVLASQEIEKQAVQEVTQEILKGAINAYDHVNFVNKEIELELLCWDVKSIKAVPTILV